jgi:osmoprotectant transport system substrate-binding protein
VVLADNRSLQPAENITPVVRRDLIARYGTRLLTLLNTVSARLDTGSLRALDAQVEVAGRQAGPVARDWLRENGLAVKGGAVR